MRDRERQREMRDCVKREREIDKVNKTLVVVVVFLRIELQCNSTFKIALLRNRWCLQVRMLGLFGALMLKFSYI